MAEVRLIWKSQRYMRLLREHLMKTMTKIVLLLEAETKKLISRGNITGKTPSAPGEPPKVRTGTLRASITHGVGIEGKEVVGYFGVRKGPADKYGKPLEEGLKDGTKRPFLRPTLLQNRVRILRMLK